jgi:hypothetical protein
MTSKVEFELSSDTTEDFKQFYILLDNRERPNRRSNRHVFSTIYLLSARDSLIDSGIMSAK